MPKKDGTGPKGHGLKNGHGKGKGPGQIFNSFQGKGNEQATGQGPMTGGKKGVKIKPQK
ncbi:MAG: hypothetical protein PF637_06945 [Spirochaetes bacterium]|jgi:hypothetical protein|nr:hypothetical protein [Spirochaetota bacterium]